MGYREFNGTENYLDESAIAAQSQKMALACALWWEVLTYRKRIGHLFRFVHRDVRSLRNGYTTPAAERKRNMFGYFAIYAGKDVTDRALGVLATVIPEEYRRNSRRKPG